MQRMFSDKIRVHLNGNIYSGGDTFPGMVEYVCDESMEYMIGSSVEASGNFIPSPIIQLHFLSPSGSTFDLTCNVICFQRSQPGDNTLTMGMKVLNPPPHYMEFIDTLKPGDLSRKWE